MQVLCANVIKRVTLDILSALLWLLWTVFECYSDKQKNRTGGNRLQRYCYFLDCANYCEKKAYFSV